jgi:MFS family permease
MRGALAAYFLFNLNEWASWIALLVWAYDAEGVRGASAIAVAQLVPSAVLASPAAAWLGRMRGPRALRLGYAAQAVSMAVVGVAVLLEVPFVVACVVAACSAVTMTFTRPVHHALLPEISDTAAELTAGNAGSGSMEAAAIFLGPLVSGILTAWWHPGGVLVAMGAASTLGVLCTLGLGPGVPHTFDDGSDTGPSASRSVLRDPAARLLSGMVAAEYVLIGTLDILIVVLALDILETSSAGPGVLNSAAGLGGVVGAAFTVVLIGSRRLAPVLVAAAVVAGVPIALAGLSTSVLPAFALIALGGAGKVFFDVTVRTFVQRLLPDRLLTAMFGLNEATSMAGLALGAVVAPALVTGLGPALAFVVTGLFLPVVAGLAWWTLGRLDASTVVPADRLALLQEVSVFAPLAPRVVERLALFSGREWHEPGVAVVREGEVGDLFYVIESGEAVVAHGSDTIRRLGAGDWFGELALLHADRHRTATVTADTLLTLLTVDRTTFLTALAGAPRSRSAVDDHARVNYR